MALSPTYTETVYAPTCTGNGPVGDVNYCSDALTTCPQADDVQYWQYIGTFDRKTGELLSPPGWMQQPGVFCRGVTDGVVNPVVVIGAQLERELKRLIVLKGTVSTTPKGKTLVNYATGFWTEADTYTLPQLTILGHRVTVTATPKSYDWHFGDRKADLDGGKGSPGTLDVQHTYRRRGTVEPYVVVTWTGTFKVDGAGPFPVVGTAVTTGDATPLQIEQARAQLING